MESLRFVHAADLHLDSPFRGIAEASARVRDRLQSATLHALSRVVDHTIHSKADFLIIAGDIYDSKDRNLRASKSKDQSAANEDYDREQKEESAVILNNNSQFCQMRADRSNHHHEGEAGAEDNFSRRQQQNSRNQFGNA